MASDSECREVARRLRSVDVNDILFDSELVDAIEHACGSKRKRRDFGKIIERLADLIEPSEGQNESGVSGIDCDALLELAYEFERAAFYRQMRGELCAPIGVRVIREYACRIREALGDDNAR